ncbi:MAG: hypothetical protein GY765_21830, partial [bacterium]|nr:hypothetical protein [bacterium]
MKKNSLLLKLVLFCFVLSLLGSASLLQADKTLDLQTRTQEHSNWCWSACSQSILYHFGQYPTQCAIANYAWGRYDCCNNYDFYWRHNCNQSNQIFAAAGSMNSVLSAWDVNSYGYYSAISFSSCAYLLDSYGPFVMGFRWTSGGGHVVVGYGYINSGQHLKYMDPWPGEGKTTVTYNWALSASDHNWDQT